MVGPVRTLGNVARIGVSVRVFVERLARLRCRKSKDNFKNQLKIARHALLAPGRFSGLRPRQYGACAVHLHLGWVFDIMDMFLLVLVKDKAMKELLGEGATNDAINSFGAWAMALTLIGWSLGGLIFGVVADKWGARARWR